jgi:hypothetical protein
MSVSIFDHRSRLNLVRIGDPDLGYPPTAYLTRVELTSGPFAVSVEAHGLNYAHVVEELSRLNDTMAGKVSLNFWNEQHSIVFVGDGVGGIGVEATITDGQTPPLACLNVLILLDQSYLSGIIASLREHFPIIE